MSLISSGDQLSPKVGFVFSGAFLASDAKVSLEEGKAKEVGK